MKWKTEIVNNSGIKNKDIKSIEQRYKKHQNVSHPLTLSSGVFSCGAIAPTI